MRKTGLFLASIKLRSRHGLELSKRKGWMSLTGQMPRPISVFWQAMHWKGVKLVSVVGVLPVNILYYLKMMGKPPFESYYWAFECL